MPIKVLDVKIAAKIAAGEVVERPASVVKELVENSLDAGSSQISVETTQGGVGFIRVSDNGSGIPAGEVEIAFSRYATSKLSSINDLESISSLGFRGEALPSIAAAAEIDIVTCATEETIGTTLNLQDGVVTGKSSKGRSRGTTITVKYLFRKIPARLKFLKTPSTENSHIAHVVSNYSMAFPGVKFSLTIDGRQTLNSAGNGKLIDSIIEVYGVEIARHMIDIDSTGTPWQGNNSEPLPIITGMIGDPTINRSNREYINLFVNRRAISSRNLTFAIEEAYHGLLMQGKHPIAIINIEIPPDEIDVNIHPTKAEVKFQHERTIFTAVQRAIRNALVSTAPVPGIEEAPVKYEGRLSTAMLGQLWTSTVRKDNNAVSSGSVPLQQIGTGSLPALRIIGQISGTYIIAEGPDGLYIIDQHAAHERILFEKVKTQISDLEVEVQGLLEPATFEVSPRQDELLSVHYEELNKYGFSIEPFGDRTYLVRSVPSLLYNRDWMAMVRELLDESIADVNPNWPEEIAASIACHSAIRAGKTLTTDEMRELVIQLEQTALPRSCPHGRPTVIHLGLQQLEKQFRRT